MTRFIEAECLSPSERRGRLSLSGAERRGYGAAATLKKRIAAGVLREFRVGNRLEIPIEDLEAMAGRADSDLARWARAQSAPPLRTAAVVGDHALRDWARKIAETAPPLSEKQHTVVVAVLGGAAA